MFHRIVVPLDGSTRAKRAVPVAARIARACGGSVALLSVLAPPIELAWQMHLALLTLEERAAARQRIAAALAQLAASEELKGVETAIEVGEGFPAQVILDRAQAHQADLLVLCSHGHTGMTRWALGSVAHKVVHHSAVPVLVLREGGEPSTSLPPEGTRPARVMVALDGSCFAEAAVLPAVHLSSALSAPLAGALHLIQIFPRLAEPLHVLDITQEGERHYELIPEEDRQAIAAGTTYLSTVQQRLLREEGARGKLQITSSVVVHSDIADALLAAAEHGQGMEAAKGPQECDVIAMATHGRGRLGSWVMGSTTERVLQATRLPLLLVRSRQRT